MKNVVLALLLVAGVVSAVSCNKLLNCKTCADEMHCKDCPSGYILDDKKVCRYDCSKYGENCTSCTDKKCTQCGIGMDWSVELGKCINIFKCTAEDGPGCSFCGKGLTVLDPQGKCSTCEAVFGTGCATCSYSHCLTVLPGYQIIGGIAAPEDCGDSCPAECSALFPGCSECDSDKTKCVTCADYAELDGDFCKYKEPVCENGTKALYINGELKCGTCAEFGSLCRSCSPRGCESCGSGNAPDANGMCMVCSKTFPGCGLCSANGCRFCSSTKDKVLTPNGCFDQHPFVAPSESNGGAVAGIVIGALAFIVIVVIVVYCIVTSVAKKGTIDPAFASADEDFEFKSMSML